MLIHTRTGSEYRTMQSVRMVDLETFALHAKAKSVPPVTADAESSEAISAL